ncbi:MAG: hypothetical protein L0221_14395, partial [Chloroflexi bacterium]|nr:hypothetical protein [Chloroflexota bacterium]
AEARMARNPLQEFIDLARAAEAAQALVDRGASLEQACREAEARLRSLRVDETATNSSITAASREAAALVAKAKIDAERLVAEAEHASAEKWSDCESQCVKAVETNEAVVHELQEKADNLKAKCALLEKEEAALGQSVAALRADLAAIKAKLG